MTRPAAPSEGSHTWPAEALGPAMELLARRSGARPAGSGPPATAAELPPSADLTTRLRALAASRGLEVEPAGCSLADLRELLRSPTPAVLPLRGSDEVVVKLGARGGRPIVLDRRLRPQRSKIGTLVEEMVGPVLDPPRRELDGLLSAAGTAPGRRRRAVERLLAERLGDQELCRAYLLRLPASAPFLRQLRGLGLLGDLARLLLAQAAAVALFVCSWWLLGRGALSGHLDGGWLLAWLLLLLALVPAGLVQGRSQACITLGAGALLERRLLHGALRLDPDLLRPEGSGHLLGRVIESKVLARLGLGASFLAPMALIEVVAAAWIASLTPARSILLPLLLVAVAGVGALTVHLFGSQRRWTENRRSLTHELVEKLEGHRTRLVQQARHRWHTREDATLAAYLAESRGLDRANAALQMAPRLWLCLGLVGLYPSFVSSGVGAGAAASSASMAVALGAVLLAQRGLASLTSGAGQLIGAAVAWRQVAPLFRAGAAPEAEPASFPAAGLAALEAPAAGATVVDGLDLGFGFAGRPGSVFQDLSLRVRAGEKILLTGPSGGGKSTLVSLLTGLRRPSSGLLLLRGLDITSLGEGAWRRRVAGAPQFHDNHIFTETLAFNLLLGRRWPPERDDLRQARDLCLELGLGELLARMPAGLFQMVGESGWQLSHGERSRVFLARALLQGGDLVVLDESTVALDPENASRALDTARRHAPTLVLVAHP
ncbi:MAG: ABC transporter ATP-binding protein/permease [Holophagales bacterium]|nr:ABC transporter ATP-binding protein/permease [Holophagales bacterium]